MAFFSGLAHFLRGLPYVPEFWENIFVSKLSNYIMLTGYFFEQEQTLQLRLHWKFHKKVFFGR
jgi:hypothetical protein